jgi:hypothetical protein
MQQITATARLIGADDEPVAGLALQLEIHALASGWTVLAEAKTGQDGAFRAAGRVEAPAQGAAHVYAPSLRLIEKSDDPTPRVLATGGALSYGGPRRPALLVDFGEIERLEENRFVLRSTQGQPMERVHAVAGLPRRPEINVAMLTRTMARRSLLNADTARNLGAAAGATTTTQPREAAVSLDRFNAELLSFTARETTLRSELSARDLKLAESTTRIAALERSVAETAARVAAAEREKEQAEEAAQLLRDAVSRETPIKALAASIGKEAAAANTAMEAEAAGFRIAKMQVSLHGSVAPDGDRIALANIADVVKGASPGRVYQGFVFDFVPDRRPTPRPQTGTPVPDVLGLTESAARRALAAAGLGLSAATRPGGASGRFSVGQAVQQAPTAGQQVPPGETVIVVFAAP